MYDKMHGLLSPLRVSGRGGAQHYEAHTALVSAPSYGVHTRSTFYRKPAGATSAAAPVSASASASAWASLTSRTRTQRADREMPTQFQRHSATGIVRPQAQPQAQAQQSQQRAAQLHQPSAQPQAKPQPKPVPQQPAPVSALSERMVQSATFYKARARGNGRGRRDRSNTDSATVLLAQEERQRASMCEMAGATAATDAVDRALRGQDSSAAAAAASSTTQPEAACGWRVAVDPKSKRPYYYHVVTRETTWKKPAELIEKEKKERSQFFATMEHNIRAKLRKGDWFARDSLTSPKDLDDGNTSGAKRFDDDGELSSGSTSCRSSWSSNASTASGTRSASSTPPRKTATLDADLMPPSTRTKVPLFRTLSSYETPDVSSVKKSHSDGRANGIPSPIQERVRLAAMDSDEALPRMSDLESYTRPQPQSTAAPSHQESKSTNVDQQPTIRRRSNSTSTIYVPMGTLNAPDQQGSIHCVSTVLRAHLMEAQAAPIACAKRFNVFLNRRDQILDVVPSLKEIGAFIRHVFGSAQMESECIVMSLIYVERLLKATVGSLQLQPCNWRSIVFCSMVMASKVWDDLSMCNADFSKIWPELSLKEINDLELTYLGAVEYNVRVSAVSYAKYYFNLRSMCASMGMLESFDESAPLNLEGARKMQVLSEEYQERSKLLPEPRRRSVTITTPSAERATRRGDVSPIKSSPAASLEQLVQMQLRVAGGGQL